MFLLQFRTLRFIITDLCIAVIGSFLKYIFCTYEKHCCLNKSACCSTTKDIGRTACYVHKLLQSVALNCLQTQISLLM